MACKRGTCASKASDCVRQPKTSPKPPSSSVTIHGSCLLKAARTSLTQGTIIYPKIQKIPFSLFKSSNSHTRFISLLFSVHVFISSKTRIYKVQIQTYRESFYYKVGQLLLPLHNLLLLYLDKRDLYHR